jgi:uncharacterized protein
MGRHEHKVKRRLIAIFTADVAGYSRMMEQDEVGTLQTLAAHRATMDQLIAQHGGRIANTAGDSVLAEFPSAVNAVECAIKVQKEIADSPSDPVLQFRDIPFAKPDELGPETAAVMAVMTDRVRQEIKVPVGINVLTNGAVAALASAKASGADFVRVNQWANAYVANEGFMEGKAGAASRYRAWLRAREVKIFADVHVKHGSHAIVADRSLPELTRDAEFFDADAVIVTGQRTGDSAAIDDLSTVKRSTDLAVMVGSGVSRDNISQIFDYADAVIVASSLKHGGSWWNEVDPERVADFMSIVRKLRP